MAPTILALPPRTPLWIARKGDLNLNSARSATQQTPTASAYAGTPCRADLSIIEAFCDFLTERHGCILKAWRRVLDPGGGGEIFFSEFIHALTSLAWPGDASALWGALVRRSIITVGDATIGLRELSPEDDLCLSQFQRWAATRYAGTVAMFKTLTGDGHSMTSLGYSVFAGACVADGFEGNIDKVFHEVLDLDGVGSVSLNDMAFLEPNALRRQAVLDPSFQMDLDAAKATARQMRQRNRRMRKAQEAAMRSFKQKVRAVSGGSFIRGFRKILDLDGNLCISKTELLKGCRKIGFVGDVVALWKAMDVDDDGSVSLQEVDIKMALVLATFKKWATGRSGSCVAALEQFRATARRRSPKWNFDDFGVALRSANFPGTPMVTQKHAASMLHEACDLDDDGYITSRDVMFIDNWEPTPWLCADPNYEERDRFINALQNRFDSLIVGWKRLLDRDNTNRVSYKEFCNACRVLRFPSPPGIWRALDEDTSGFISLGDVDRGSSDALLRFKTWAEGTFGTIQRAFRALDTTRSNALSLSVFKRGLRGYGFEDDAKVLFEILKPDVTGKKGRREVRVTLEDLKYLSTWECSQNDDDSDAEEEESPTAGGRLPSARSEARLTRRRSQSQVDSPKIWSPESPPPAMCDSSTSRIPPPRMQEKLWFCRSHNEYSAFRRCSQQSFSGTATSLKKLSALQQSVSDFQLPPARRTFGGTAGSLGGTLLPAVTAGGSPRDSAPTALPPTRGPERSPMHATASTRFQTSMSLPALGSSAGPAPFLPPRREAGAQRH